MKHWEKNFASLCPTASAHSRAGFPAASCLWLMSHYPGGPFLLPGIISHFVLVGQKFWKALGLVTAKDCCVYYIRLAVPVRNLPLSLFPRCGCANLNLTTDGENDIYRLANKNSGGVNKQNNMSATVLCGGKVGLSCHRYYLVLLV